MSKHFLTAPLTIGLQKMGPFRAAEIPHDPKRIVPPAVQCATFYHHRKLGRYSSHVKAVALLLGGYSLYPIKWFLLNDTNYVIPTIGIMMIGIIIGIIGIIIGIMIIYNIYFLGKSCVNGDWGNEPINPLNGFY